MKIKTLLPINIRQGAMLKIRLVVILLTTATALASAQGKQSASIKMANGDSVQGRIIGKIAFDDGFATGGNLLAGDAIDRIDEQGIRVRVGTSIVFTILPLSNRYTMEMNPPFALILENVENAIAKEPEKVLIGVSFSAPCKLFADTTCDSTNIDVNIVVGKQETPQLERVIRILGEFRLQNGKGIIIPALTIMDSNGKTKSLKLESIVAFRKL